MDADTIDLEDDAGDESGRPVLISNNLNGHAIALRLSAQVKDPLHGFKFGRNSNRCDLCFANDPLRRLSNVHFRIFINEYGVLTLQDQSTNGTIVDNTRLRARAEISSRTIRSGSRVTISLPGSNDISFLVAIPRREDEYERLYRSNLVAYQKRLASISREQEEPMSAGSTERVSCSSAIFSPKAHSDRSTYFLENLSLLQETMHKGASSFTTK